MKFRFALLVAMTASLWSVATASAATSVQTERIRAAYVLAFGRPPTAQEVTEAEKQADLSLSDQLARLRSRLKDDAALNQAVVLKAAVDAFGRPPTAGESSASSSGVKTYTELVKQHLAWIASHPAEYEQIQERAYQRVIGRSVFPGEITYWKKYDALPYVLLVGCIENWGRRNAPGLMETTGTPTVSANSRYVTTIALSPAVAAEARQAAGLPVTGDAAFAAEVGRNLVAPGAANIVTTGHMHLVAAGAEELLPSPAGS
ncbi:MAG: hypothetical protein ABIZ04_23385 [Opitutus sp.]